MASNILLAIEYVSYIFLLRSRFNIYLKSKGAAVQQLATRELSQSYFAIRVFIYSC